MLDSGASFGLGIPLLVMAGYTINPRWWSLIWHRNPESHEIIKIHNHRSHVTIINQNHRSCS